MADSGLLGVVAPASGKPGGYFSPTAVLSESFPAANLILHVSLDRGLGQEIDRPAEELGEFVFSPDHLEVPNGDAKVGDEVHRPAPGCPHLAPPSRTDGA